jgi:hypothetical protein
MSRYQVRRYSLSQTKVVSPHPTAQAVSATQNHPVRKTELESLYMSSLDFALPERLRLDLSDS